MTISCKDIFKLRSYLKEQILNSSNFIGCENEKKQLVNLLKRTIENGESNSALLIGPRGAGKTLLMNEILKESLQKKNFDSNAILVRLNGLLQTDDRLALKSITSQMNLENAVDGKVFGSFAENLSFLLACLRTGQKETSKSIIFILEEFDLFCAHHNQTLLYNLFDVSQSDQTPICVFGITTRLDIIELFEKRVKSRFSHRQIFLLNEQDESSNFQQRINRIHTLLTCRTIGNMQKCNLNKWNSSIENLLREQRFINALQRLFDVNSTEGILKNLLVLVVSRLNEKKVSLTATDFEEVIHNFLQDDLTCIIKDLSILELCLLIAMKHHTEIYEDQPFNFEIIFTRYTKFVDANSNVQGIERIAVFKAFQHLQKIELIAPILNIGSSRLQKEYQLFRLLVTFQQITDAAKKFSNLPTEVRQWVNSSLI